MQLSYGASILIIIFLTGTSRAENLTTRDCSPILNNVQGGGNISIDIRCDQKSEEQLIRAVAAEPWKKECQLAIPQSWYAHFDGANSVWEIAPTGSSYFSRFDFGVRFWRTLNPYTEEDKQFEDSPEGQKASEAPYELVLDTSLNKPAIDKMYIRIFVQMEDGSELQRGVVSVGRDGNEYVSSMEFEDQIDAYPMVGKEYPAVSFECRSDASMDLSAFKDLCKMVIEKTTVDSEFHSSSCEGGQLE